MPKRDFFLLRHRPAVACAGTEVDWKTDGGSHMTWQRLPGTVCLFIAAFFFLPHGGHCAGQNPEQFIKEFYTWYITKNEGAFKAFDGDEIYKYVEKETVEKIKSEFYRECSACDQLDYVTKRYASPLSMSGVTISVGKVTQMDTKTFVAPVTIIETSSSGYIGYIHVVVVLREKDGALKIFKCIDIYPEA